MCIKKKNSFKRSVIKTHSASVLQHSTIYTEILDIYVKSIQFNIHIKFFFKLFFFIATMAILGIILYYFCKVVNYTLANFSDILMLKENMLDVLTMSLSVVFPSVCSLIVALIKIPEIIAKYLFDTDEDKYMDSVIKNIQDYDKDMYGLEAKVLHALDDTKYIPPSFEDNPVKQPKHRKGKNENTDSNNLPEDVVK